MINVKTEISKTRGGHPVPARKVFPALEKHQPLCTAVRRRMLDGGCEDATALERRWRPRCQVHDSGESRVKSTNCEAASGNCDRSDAPAQSELRTGADTNDAAESSASAADLHGDSTGLSEVGAALPSGSSETTFAQSSSTFNRHEICQPQHYVSVLPHAAAFSVEELKDRAVKMFAGSEGGPRASGSPSTMDAVTVALLIAAVKAIDKLMGTPKKPGPRRAEFVKCCVELDKEEARGWLVADAVGRPLLHRNDDRSQNDARRVGKRVLERATAWQKDVDSAAATGKSAVRAATHAARKDSSLLSGIANAEAAGARALAKVNATVVDVDLPPATGGWLRPQAYWQRREEAEVTEALHAAKARSMRLWQNVEAALNTRGAAKLALDKARARADAYTRMHEPGAAGANAYSASEYLRRTQPEKYAFAAYIAAIDDVEATGRSYISSYERELDLHVLVHGANDEPPGAVPLSAEERLALLAEWSVEAIADRFGNEDFELMFDASDVIDDSDPRRQWKLDQIDRAVQEHTKRLDARLSPQARLNLERMKFEARIASQAAQEAATAAAQADADAEVAAAMAVMCPRPAKRVNILMLNVARAEKSRKCTSVLCALCTVSEAEAHASAFLSLRRVCGMLVVLLE